MTIFIVLWKTIRKHQILVLFVMAFLCMIAGAGLFAITQHTSFFIALYWAVTTATTVGYGDITPHNTAGRVIAMGVMLTTIPLMGAVFAAWAAVLASIHIRRVLGLEKVWDHQGHLVVYGFSPTVAHMLDELISEKSSVIVVADVHPGSVPEGIRLIAGDATNPQVLAKSHPETARQALISGSTDGEVLLTAIALKHLVPKLPIMAITQSAKVAEALKDLGVEHTVAADNLLGQTVAKSLETPHAADLLLSLLGSDRYALTEHAVDSQWVGQPLSHVRHSYPGMLLGIVHKQQVILGVEQDPVVQADDNVLFLTATKLQ